MPTFFLEPRLSMDLADGRRLAYSLTGPVDGVPVLYCHGAIGTPLSATLDLDRICAAVGVRCLAPTRPGIGGSDPHPGRRIADWADDARQLADHLDLDRLYVVGVSAGGPYALALARQLGPRIRRVALVSSLSPSGPPHATPGLARRVRYPLAGVHALPRGDWRGVRGLVADYHVSCEPWGFSAATVDCEVDLWHGGRDGLVPVEHALALAASLPCCAVYCDPDAGHHFFRARLATILERLLDPPATIRLRRGGSAVPGVPPRGDSTAPSAVRRGSAAC